MDSPKLPGKRIREMRKQAGLTLRELAEMCDPVMDYTTIGRIERGNGYSSDSLERFAVVFKCSVSDFFLPDELARYSNLSKESRHDIVKHINALADAELNRSA